VVTSGILSDIVSRLAGLPWVGRVLGSQIGT
jgi:hypothetical protein